MLHTDIYIHQQPNYQAFWLSNRSVQTFFSFLPKNGTSVLKLQLLMRQKAWTIHKPGDGFVGFAARNLCMFQA